MRKNKILRAFLALSLVIALLLSFSACKKKTPAPAADPVTVTEQSGGEETEQTDPAETPNDSEEDPEPEQEPDDGDEDALDENGAYYSKEEVALYVHLYGHLPDNFITKKEAQALGWSGGSIEKYAAGKVIGGSRFYNNEGLLPEKEGRIYTECDIDTLGKDSRGAKRIVFSNDGLVYYTGDHYESFELLYGDPDA